MRKPNRQLLHAAILTTLFGVVAAFGLWHHEMWRDEHQAWLVARDAHSLAQLFENMRYEGNPALWQFLLYLVTLFTSNPAAMQPLHLLLACGFVFVFNRYAPFSLWLKGLFSFGYFTAYEYCVISRNYALGVLFLFLICALYKNRSSHYVRLGVVLALLANVSLFTVVVSVALASILVSDYWVYQTKGGRNGRTAAWGLTIYGAGVLLSLWQIWPEKDNTFPVSLAGGLFQFSRWAQAVSRLWTAYFCTPDFHGMHFWNSNLYLDAVGASHALSGAGLPAESQNHVGWLFMGGILFCLGILTFLRKPLVLLFYVVATAALIGIFYYTLLLYARYYGTLLMVLVASFWLSADYADHSYRNSALQWLARIGKRAGQPLLVAVLMTNCLGTLVAYAKDCQYEFSPSKDVAQYIRENRLDRLTIIGATDFVLSPLASYLNTRLYYQDVNDYGSFCVWSKQRNPNLTLRERVDSIANLTAQGRRQLLVIWSAPLTMYRPGQAPAIAERARINTDIKLELLKVFEPGIVEDEQYYLYLAQKVDPSKEDLSGYKPLK